MAPNELQVKNPLRVVIVEDSELICTQLRQEIESRGGIRVIGTASSESTAVDLILGCFPDVVLLDVNLQPGSGIKVLRKVRKAGHTCRIFMLTNEVTPAYRAICGALGISGYFDKSFEMERCLSSLYALL